jgi:hypothetical protein
MKRTIILMLFVCVAVVLTVSIAKADTAYQSWEAPTYWDPEHPEWGQSNWPNHPLLDDMQGGLEYGSTTGAGVTDGVQAATVLMAASGWQWAGSEWCWGNYDQLKNHSILKLDITPGYVYESDPQEAGTAAFGFIINGGDPNWGWRDMGETDGWVDLPIGVTTTVVWDYYDEAIAHPFTSAGWNKIGFVFSTSGDRQFTLDNLRFEGVAAPEPATIVMLAIAGLMGLLYWRKR